MNALVAESVLCVAVDNNEVAGEYFASAPETQMTVASAFRKNPKLLSFGSAYASGDLDLLGVSTVSTTTATARSSYSPGDVIRTFAVAADEKPVRAPVLSGFGAAVGSNECRELSPVRFEFVQELTTCTRAAVMLGSACSDAASFLSAAPFVQNLLVAKRPNVTSSAAASDVLSIEVEVSEFNFKSGTSAALAPPFPSYFPTPEYSKSNNVCHGALLGLEYTVFHDALGHLERIRAKVTVGNISAAEPASSIDMTQSFAVAFQSQSSLPSGVVSLANGNVLEYQRSGNPGYQQHYPVRVGVVESKSAVSVVSEMIGGLQIPGLGDCLSSALVSQPIAFGEDSQTSCSLSLSAGEFKALCTRSEPLLPPLRVNFTRVATFGNSDPLLESEWLELDYDAPTKSTATFSDATDPGSIELTCQDVIASVNLEFLVARVGPVANPQHKIIAARAFHSKETWTFWRSETKKQTFLLRTTVTFVAVASTQLEQLIPPSPPIWFSIPNDVFYPFIMNDATGAAMGRPPWGFLCLLWIAAALLQL